MSRRSWRESLLLFAHRTRMPLREGNTVVVYADGGDLLAACRELIGAAVRTLDVEMYIWAGDATGRGFASLLEEAARRGVTVRAIYDALGSWGSPLDRLAASGVRIVPYHPLSLWRFRYNPNRRNHRKLVIADDTAAVVGSQNWADEYDTRAYPEGYRDIGLGVVGPAVADLALDFRRCWKLTTGERLPGPQTPRADLSLAGASFDRVPVQVVSGLRRGDRNAIRRLYLFLVRRASTSVLIGNSYFVPGRLLVRALTAAARRRVSVRLVVPGATDQSFLQLAARSTYGRLLGAGVRIFEREGRILHAKVAVIDGEIAVAGSANLDTRSFRHNLELNLEVHDPRIASTLSEALERDVAASREVTASEAARLPFWTRLLQGFAYLFKYWL